MVVKDMAQDIWGRGALVERTYGGKLSLKDNKNSTAVVIKEEAKPAEGCFDYWQDCSNVYCIMYAYCPIC